MKPELKPVKMAHFSDGLTPDKLFFLNITTFCFHYITRLLTRNITKNNIRSKGGGLTLPNEIWAMILEYIREDEKEMKEKGVKDKFCLVKAELVAASPKRMLLRCFRHEFDCPEYNLLENLSQDSQSVYQFEQLLRHTSLSMANQHETDLPELRRLSDPDYVVLNTTSTDHFLYEIRDAPEFFAVMGDDNCWFCGGAKFFCPGCTGGLADNFDVFMGCDVDLACPVCLGVDFSRDHKGFLEGWYYEDAPEGEAEGMLELLEERLEELGYGMDVPEGAWRGGTMGMRSWSR
ncbi:hypothetical protein F5Y13DRAFT_133563 [Hypoxylon sp. FL1857]|nr:hypothetical protein F5Y13DRAFT_133563 [Hypoxylon sp. FL1857]